MILIVISDLVNLGQFEHTNLTLKKCENVVQIPYFILFIYKTDNFLKLNSNLWSAEFILKDFLVCQNILPDCMVQKLKKFGKHCTNQMMTLAVSLLKSL